MTTTLVLPTDNAVIDYSIISQIIAAINAQQQQIDAFTKSTTSIDPVTNTQVITKVLQGISAKNLSIKSHKYILKKYLNQLI